MYTLISHGFFVSLAYVLTDFLSLIIPRKLCVIRLDITTAIKSEEFSSETLARERYAVSLPVVVEQTVSASHVEETLYTNIWI